MEELKFIAAQLRKPSGEFARKVADKMNVGNRPLYDLMIQTMGIGENESVLEIGFGSGAHFRELISQADGVQICGIDYSEEMLNFAQQYNRDATESGQLKLALGNSDNLPFKESQFDKIFCNMVIYFWDNPEQHLSEIHRVLKPDGKFFTGMRTRKSMLELPFTKFGFNLYSKEEWMTIMEENSFNVQNTTSKIDPPFEEGGKMITLESVCITSEKNKK